VKKITIVQKITLWYTLLTVVLLAVLLPVLYLSISTYLYREEVNQLHTAAAVAASSIETNEGTVSMNDTTDISPNIPTTIWDGSQSIIFQNNSLDWLASLPFDKGQIRKVDHQNETWLVYDSAVTGAGGQAATLRVSSSFESIENALSEAQIAILVSIPLYLLLAVCGSLFIAKRSLKPVRQITRTANQIKGGDLSSRITGVESPDEVGDLARTFNDMLERVEASFTKERLFSSAASHELRTPVTVITAYSESLLGESQQDRMASAESTHALEQILGESKRMSTIISQLLLLSRGDEDSYRLILEKINLSEVIGAVLQQMEEQAGQAHITLSYHGKDFVPVTADQSLMTQMMLNLIGNAIKYGKAGGRVDISVEQDARFVHITVADDGRGIDPEELPHIFERFYRADRSRDRSGSGLGLSIVEWIIKAHQGTVQIESAVGSGTTFTLQLPVLADADQNLPPASP